MSTKKTKGIISEDFLYSFICKHPNLSTYELSKKIEWTGGKVRTTIKRLEEAKLIEGKFVREGMRIKKLIVPSHWKKLINWENIESKSEMGLKEVKMELTQKNTLITASYNKIDKNKKAEVFSCR